MNLRKKKQKLTHRSWGNEQVKMPDFRENLVEWVTIFFNAILTFWITWSEELKNTNFDIVNMSMNQRVSSSYGFTRIIPYGLQNYSINDGTHFISLQIEKLKAWSKRNERGIEKSVALKSPAPVIIADHLNCRLKRQENNLLMMQRLAPVLRRIGEITVINQSISSSQLRLE